MKKQIYFILCLLFIAVGCTKEDSDTTGEKSGLRSVKNIDYDDYLDFNVDCVKEQIQRDRSSDKDRLKYTLAKFFAVKFEDAQFKSEILNLMKDSEVTSTKKNTVFLSDLLQSQVTGGNEGFTNFEELLNDYYEENFPNEAELLESLCSTNWDVVVQMPWWGDEIIKESSLDIFTQKYSFVAAVEPVICNNENSRIAFLGNKEFVIKTDKFHIGHIPIYIKQVEHFTEYDLGEDSELMQIFSQINKQFGNCTFSIYDLNNFIKHLDCANIKAVDLIAFIKFANDFCSVREPEICDNGIDDDEDGYIDCDDMKCDCIEICGNGIDDDQDGEIDEDDCIENVEGEICDNYIDDDGDGLIDSEDEIDCPCEKRCLRDCIVESNVLKAVKFGNGGYARVCQTHDEDNIELEYTFSAVKLCSQSTSDDCLNINLRSLEPGKDRYYLAGGSTALFFEMQKDGRVHKDDVHEYEIYEGTNGIVYVAEDPDDDNWFIYWKAYPKYVTLNFRYLEGEGQNNWNGDLIGNVIEVVVYELDNNTVTSTETKSSTSSVSTTYNASVNANLSLSKIVSIGARASYTYRNSETNRQSNSIVKRYLQDIKLAEFNLLYCDEDNHFPDPTGVSGNTWYGHTPGITDLVNENGPLFFYQEFRVLD